MKRVTSKRRKLEDDGDNTSSVVARGDHGDSITFFLTQRDLMRVIARHIPSTRQLFSFLLHVCPQLRHAYTTQKRWNAVFDLRRRIAETWGRVYVCPRNVLGVFVAWAASPRSCLAGCGKSKRASADYCNDCLWTRIKHPSEDLARLRFAACSVRECDLYYYVCRPEEPPRTLEDDLSRHVESGMVLIDDIIGWAEARRICAQEGLDLNLKRHTLEFWDHQGRRFAGTLECVLRGWTAY